MSDFCWHFGVYKALSLTSVCFRVRLNIENQRFSSDWVVQKSARASQLGGRELGWHDWTFTQLSRSSSSSYSLPSLWSRHAVLWDFYAFWYSQELTEKQGEGNSFPEVFKKLRNNSPSDICPNIKDTSSLAFYLPLSCVFPCWVLVSCSAHSFCSEVQACFLISRLRLILPAASLAIKRKILPVGRLGLWIYNHLKNDWLALHRDALAIQVTLTMRDWSGSFPWLVWEVFKHLIVHGSYSGCFLGCQLASSLA